MSVIGQATTGRDRAAARAGLFFAVLSGSLIFTVVIALAVGARSLPLAEVPRALVAFDGGNFDHVTIWRFRLPRVIAAAMVGAGLAAAGCLMQSIVRNPLAEPQLLGLNAGASLAVVGWSVWLGLSGAARPLVAAGGALVAFLLVLGLSGLGGQRATPLRMTLAGIIVAAFASSLTAAFLLLDAGALEDLRLWLAGDLGGQEGARLLATAPAFAIGALLAFAIAPNLDALALGDGVARGLGVSLARTRVLALVATALLTGASVSLAGPIGCVGLVVPHLARRLVGDRLRLGLVCALPAGAILLILADTLARTLFAPIEIATGILTGATGAAVFIFLVARYFR